MGKLRDGGGGTCGIPGKPGLQNSHGIQVGRGGNLLVGTALLRPHSPNPMFSQNSPNILHGLRVTAIPGFLPQNSSLFPMPMDKAQGIEGKVGWIFGIKPCGSIRVYGGCSQSKCLDPMGSLSCESFQEIPRIFTSHNESPTGSGGRWNGNEGRNPAGIPPEPLELHWDLIPHPSSAWLRNGSGIPWKRSLDLRLPHSRLPGESRVRKPRDPVASRKTAGVGHGKGLLAGILGCGKPAQGI